MEIRKCFTNAFQNRVRDGLLRPPLEHSIPMGVSEEHPLDSHRGTQGQAASSSHCLGDHLLEENGCSVMLTIKNKIK